MHDGRSSEIALLELLSRRDLAHVLRRHGAKARRGNASLAEFGINVVIFESVALKIPRAAMVLTDGVLEAFVMTFLTVALTLAFFDDRSRSFRLPP